MAGAAGIYNSGLHRGLLQEKVGESISHQTEGNSERGRTRSASKWLNCLEEYYVCMAKSGNFPQGLVTSYKAQIRAAYLQERMEVFAITEAVNVIINKTE